MSEKSHLLKEIKEQRELCTNFREKSTDLWAELQKVTNEYQDYKRYMLKYDQNLKMNEVKILDLNDKLENTQSNYEDLESRYNT